MATDNPTSPTLSVNVLTLVLATVVLPIMPAMAQQRVTYGADGRTISRSVTDTQGTVTTYDASTGRALTRETRGVVYDAQSGRIVGKRAR